MNIFKEYGDYLHGKGDYSGAVQQYIKTIGKLIPSYVIRKVRGGGTVVLVRSWETLPVCDCSFRRMFWVVVTGLWGRFAF